MSFAIIFLPSPGSGWQVDAAEFQAAAGRSWPTAEISAPIATGNGTTEVMISTPPDAGFLSAILTVDESSSGYFSIQSGTGPEAAAMFAWFREWLGAEQQVSAVNTSGDGSLVEVPAGASPAQIADAIDSLGP